MEIGRGPSRPCFCYNIPMNRNDTTPVIIVSGLPRSGTSMMMKMLRAGGVPAVTDNIRAADIDNPEGYFEFEAAKKIKEDSSWLPEARGKVFKIVSLLLKDLPQGFRYKVVFIKRELKESLASQAKMLARLGTAKPGAGNVPDEVMEGIYRRHLAEIEAWIAAQPNIEALYTDYNEIVRDPAPTSRRLAAFIGGGFDAQAAAEAVNPELYRNRA